MRSKSADALKNTNPFLDKESEHVLARRHFIHSYLQTSTSTRRIISLDVESWMTRREDGSQGNNKCVKLEKPTDTHKHTQDLNCQLQQNMT